VEPVTIGVVIPVRDEELLLRRCLRSVAVSARHPRLGRRVEIGVVLDVCTDASGQIATDELAREKLGEPILSFAGNVGLARAQGADALLERGASTLVFTDADCAVDPDWLVSHVSQHADAVCGTVSVDGWTDMPAGAVAAYATGYLDRDGHRHVHGANLSVSAAAYLDVGGFSAAPCDEDVALVAELERNGYRVAWSAAPRVWTSSRRISRVDGGFASTLHRLALSHPPPPAADRNRRASMTA
jgi:cellulose synthase/poly-beta-1,6-N-acetylglucosamine synthase-like glycosyltransferase